MIAYIQTNIIFGAKPMKNKNSKHSPLDSPTNRSFGLTVGGIFLLIETYRFWQSNIVDIAGVILLTVSLPLLTLGVLYPRILTPLNRGWMKLGLILHKIVNPVVMLLLYVVTICTTGLAMRAFGKDPLNLKFDKDAKTYWIARSPKGPSPETMKNQF